MSFSKRAIEKRTKSWQTGADQICTNFGLSVDLESGGGPAGIGG
jgi:hypothetical protein